MPVIASRVPSELFTRVERVVALNGENKSVFFKRVLLEAIAVEEQRAEEEPSQRGQAHGGNGAAT